jgi:hypothetical protein
MKRTWFVHSLLLAMAVCSCNNNSTPSEADNQVDSTATVGTFGYDLFFLRRYDTVIVLKTNGGKSQVIVSPKYQAKVFTSTANGMNGLSFGWVNYKAFSDTVNAHMNAFGGEDRVWLGPEGGMFSLFFAPGSKMEFRNWKTPAAFDTEAWNVTSKNAESVSLHKDMNLVNYAGARFQLSVDRTIKILNTTDIASITGVTISDSVDAVGYETRNVLMNKGSNVWSESTGAPCIWMLDMLKTTASTVIVIPFKDAAGQNFKEVATTTYFGEIQASRLKHDNQKLFFKADGKKRGKLGIKPPYALPFLGSYDAETNLLTIAQFHPDASAKYLNQEWNTSKPPYSGDAVNAYNDGPLPDGTQMGPFYEIETVSPAAFLQPGESLSHHHSVFHFTGNEHSLDLIAQKLLGISINEIKAAFGNPKVPNK